MSVPAAQRAAIENAMIQEQIANLSVEDLKLDLLLQLETAYFAYQNQLRVLGLNKSLVENARQNLFGIPIQRF